MDAWNDEPEPPFYTRTEADRIEASALRRGFLWGCMAMLLSGFLVAQARAEDLAGRLRTIDGDTVWHYACSPGEHCKPEKIRLLDIDAPESYRSTCENELIAGLRAKVRLAELLQTRPVRIERCEASGRCEDRFGRTLARLHTPAGEVGAILVREGLALKYEPGFAAKQGRIAHWCWR